MMMDTLREITTLLQAFQEGYTRRDVSQVDAFMDLFADDCEVIGTNGIRPGVDEWYTSRAAARALVEGDWEGWGDLRLDFDTTSIHARGEVGWIAASATVAKVIGPESYTAFLDFAREFIEQSPLPAEQKLHFLLRGGMNTVYELRRGATFVWPLRLTAVVVRQADGWKFAQVNFSFPTIYFPDVRILDGD